MYTHTHGFRALSASSSVGSLWYCPVIMGCLKAKEFSDEIVKVGGIKSMKGWVLYIAYGQGLTRFKAMIQ